MNFSELTLTPSIRRAIEAQGFTEATDIQAQAIPLIQQGRDVIGRSQTGTGKTLAFGIPAIEKVDTTGPDKNQAQILILCPTRELAVQGCAELRKMACFCEGVKCADIYGGAPMDRQIARLKTANVIIGTPGRVMDHMRRKTLTLEHLRMVVLDEADEMLSMGFIDDIKTILTSTPEQRQTLLFSATMPPAIMELTKTCQHDPAIVRIASEQTVAAIDQHFMEVPMGRKKDALVLLMQSEQPEHAMVFVNTKKLVDEVATFLAAHEVKAEGLHGDMNQSQRTKVMDGFKHGLFPILVATDVAARGIDVDDVSLVVHYDIPQTDEYYIHRTGRTGRAGKTGKAVTLCSGRRQVQVIQEIARRVKATIDPMAIPDPATIRMNRHEALIAEISTIAAGPLDYTDMVEELIGTGCSAEKAAAAVLQKWLGAPKDDIAEIKMRQMPSGRVEAEPMQKIVLSIGRDQHAAPNHIVGALTESGNLFGKEVGKIEIYDNETVVGVPVRVVEAVMADMTGKKILGTPITVRLFVDRQAKQNHYSNRGSRDNTRRFAGRSDKNGKSDHRLDHRDRYHAPRKTAPGDGKAPHSAHAAGEKDYRRLASKKDKK